MNLVISEDIIDMLNTNNRYKKVEMSYFAPKYLIDKLLGIPVSVI